MSAEREPITEDWLRAAGFKWSQLDRQPAKHWTLWLGHATDERHDPEDFGLELADGAYPSGWYCWFRSDLAGRYSRFIHVRHLHHVDELVRLIEGITGQPWVPENVWYGSLRSPEDAERLRRDSNRLDRRLRLERPWRRSSESDPTRARPTEETMDELEQAKRGHD